MRNSKQIWSVILFIIFLVAIGCTIYYWATLWVWIPLVAVSMYFFYCDFRSEKVLPYYYSWHQQAVVYGIGVVSMIWQFFYTTIIFDFQLWECLLAAGVVIILLVIAIRESIGESGTSRRQRRIKAQRRILHEKQYEVNDANS